MRKPRKNRRHEKFACTVVAGACSAEAYVTAGYKPHRANHLRPMASPEVVARIDELGREREIAARGRGRRL
jgi:hypothetical protein